MNSISAKNIWLIVVLLLTVSACNNGRTVEDTRIGQQAISISEVSLLARTGFQKEALTAIKQRHIPAPLSGEEEV